MTPRERNRLGIVLGLLALICFVAVGLWFWTRPVQMHSNADAYKTVDALYTAVRNRDEQRVQACEGKLKQYEQSGDLNADAARSLHRIIAKTRTGSWDDATTALYEFMLAQRREGP